MTDVPDILIDGPTDGISRVLFHSENLLVTSWDGTVSFYDPTGKQLSLVKFNSPVLDGSMIENSSFIAGTLKGEVYFGDLSRPDEVLEPIGSHDKAVRRIAVANPNLAFTGSWDSTVKAWDHRAGPQTTIPCSSKVYAMAVSSEQADTPQRLLVCQSNKNMAIYDIRKLSEPEITKSQVLKFQIRDCAWHPNGKIFTVSSVEGRVAWETLFTTDEEDTSKKYTFKCHREKVDGKEIVHSVNALAFHPDVGAFATGGADGMTCVWDGKHKKRLWREPRPYGISVSSLCFSSSNKLAVGCAAETEDAIPPAKLIIKQLSESDLLRRP